MSKSYEQNGKKYKRFDLWIKFQKELTAAKFGYTGNHNNWYHQSILQKRSVLFLKK